MERTKPMSLNYTADDFDGDSHVRAREALARLREGNRIYLEALDHKRDLSPDRIRELFENGQRPFATVITCADSRVVPEHIFMAGLGELFVIRVAGNVVGPMELASAVYACEHLHTRLLLVLGHTHCGAIKAALDGEQGSVAAVTDLDRRRNRRRLRPLRGERPERAGRHRRPPQKPAARPPGTRGRAVLARRRLPHPLRQGGLPVGCSPGKTGTLVAARARTRADLRRRFPG